MKFFSITRILFLLILSFLILPSLFADDVIEFSLGEAKILQVKGVKKVLVSDQKIADAVILSESEVLINAKAVGNTSLIAFVGRVKKNFFIQVLPTKLKQNMVSVDVQVMEINQSDGLKIGVDWQTFLEGSKTQTQASTGGTGQANITAKSPLNVVEIGPTALSWKPFLKEGILERGALDLFLHFLVTKGYGKILAKPKLVTISGGKAMFSSGGQIPVPVPVPGGKGEITIEWKQYGVSLEIKPTIDAQQNINVNIRAEVSGLDKGNGVTFSGGYIPGVKNRTADTTVYTKDGGTIIIAGLMQTDTSKIVAGVPILSSIPLLGELFKHTEIQEGSSELVIFVTPSVVGI